MSLRPRLVNFDDTWDKILQTLKSVITLDKIPRAVWNDRFTDVYTLCVAYPEPLGERLFDEVKIFLESHVEKLYEAISCPDVDLLQVYHHHWSQFSKGSFYMNLLFGYLNQHMKKHKQDLSDISPYTTQFCPNAIDEVVEIGPLALEIWKKKMITPLKGTLVTYLLEEIKRDRDGEMTHQHILHNTILSFVGVQEYQTRGSLQLYEEEFEKPLLKETKEYYSREAAELHADCTCSIYIQKVEQRIQDEDLRARKFLHPVSFSRVIRECESRLVEQYIPHLQTECRQMVKDEKCDDLSRMYKLLHHLPTGIKAMVSELEKHIVEIGMDTLKSLHTENFQLCGKQYTLDICQGPSQYVEALLNIHEKFTKLIKSTFRCDQAFHSALDRACITVVNYRHDPKRSSKSPELLAKYSDSLLKKSTKNLTESELDEKLNEIIIIFKYIDDKDIFQKFYSKMLAKRLIHGLSVSMDAEEGMISRLKHACGYEYTNRLHRMFTDMSISSDLNSSFSDFLSNSETNLGINFSLLVLQSGAWPLGQTSVSPLSIPQLLVNCVLKFEQFYSGRYSGRKLTWLQHLSTGDLKVSYLKRPYIVTVTTYQMAVLLLFNDRTSLAYGDILLLTELVDKELLRNLQSLVEVKLVGKTQGEDFTKCSFSLNMGFNNKRTKLKITSAVQKDTPQESEQTMQAVDDDRKLYLQATIVRVMKSRKTLKHNSLIEEVISQSSARFTPSIAMIKKCVESLIDKQYLERREGTKDEYSYVA